MNTRRSRVEGNEVCSDILLACRQIFRTNQETGFYMMQMYNCFYILLNDIFEQSIFEEFLYFLFHYSFVNIGLVSLFSLKDIF